jgi:predicted Zn-dependent protease
MTRPRAERGGAARALVVFGFIATLAGCAQLEQQGQIFSALPPTKPTAQPPRVDNRTSIPHDDLVEEFGGEYRAPASEAYLNRILSRLADASDTPGQSAYRVTILNTPVVNAFALPSGNLYVTRGLLALANDASEVAAVMAHEIAHVTSRHRALRDERQREADLIVKAADVIQSRQKGEEIRARQKLSVASFSRQQELEADAMGVRVIAKAGYDPYGASRFLSALGKSTDLRAALYGKKRSSLNYDILSEHPSTPERVSKAIAAARAIGAPGIGDRDRAGYLAAIDGVAFGDDPTTGYVHGARYTNGKLHFSFTAPEGFVLENSAEALFGVRDRENEALHLDWETVRPGQTLEAYVSSGWVEGLMRSSVRSRQINGLPAVTANARAGDWNFRLAVIQLDGRFFRLIFAVRSLTDDSERRFDASIGSFHRLSDEEAAALHAPKVAIVAASPTDTIASMSQRMATANPPGEYFRLLNGLDPDAPLIPGEHYKIVTE